MRPHFVQETDVFRAYPRVLARKIVVQLYRKLFFELARPLYFLHLCAQEIDVRRELAAE